MVRHAEARSVHQWTCAIQDLKIAKQHPSTDKLSPAVGPGFREPASGQHSVGVPEGQTRLVSWSNQPNYDEDLHAHMQE